MWGLRLQRCDQVDRVAGGSGSSGRSSGGKDYLGTRVAVFTAFLLILPGVVFAQRNEWSIEQLSESMGSVDLAERRDAAYELARRGSEALPALDALIGGLSDRDDQVWMQSTMSIARIGPDASKAIDALINSFRERGEQRRYRAAWAASRLGDAGLPKLIEASKHESSTVRGTALEAMGWMVEAFDQTESCLVASLEDESESVRAHAATSLVRLLPASSASLIPALRHDDDRIRMIAARGLSRLDVVPVGASEPLLAMTQDKDPRVRASAILATANTSLNLEDRIRVVIEAVVDVDPEVRGAAVLAMRKSGGEAQDYIALLVPLLKGEDRRTRSAAAFAIGSLGAQAVPAMDELILALQNPVDGNTISDDQKEIISAISRIGATAVPALLRATSETESRPLNIALARIGPQAIEPLVQALQADTLPQSLSAARALSEMDPLPPAAVEPLIQFLDHPSAALQQAALEGLGKCSDLDQAVIQRFQQRASSPDAGVRAAALLGMAKLNSKSSEISQILRSGIVDSDPSVRISAIEGITILGAVGETVGDVAKACEDPDPRVRVVAVNALAGLENEAQPWATAIADLLSDKEVDVRMAASAAIGQIGVVDDQVVNALSKRLQDEDTGVLIETLNSLALLGAASKPHASEILLLLQHPKTELRMGALRCIAEIDPQQAIPILIAALDDAEWTVRRDAAEALGKIGAKAKSAVPKLFRLLASEEDRDAVRGALRAIDDAGPDAVPVLVEALDSEDRRKRDYAVFLLGKVGSEARDALPELKRLLKKTDSKRSRGSIQQAIDRIEANH